MSFFGLTSYLFLTFQIFAQCDGHQNQCQFTLTKSFAGGIIVLQVQVIQVYRASAMRLSSNIYYSSLFGGLQFR